MSGEAERLLVLHGRETSVVLELDGGGAPLWRYWGPRLAGAQLGPPLRATRELPSFTLDAHAPLSVVPTFGLGWFAQSALLAHRSGVDFAHGFTQCEWRWRKPGSAVVILLRDAVAALELQVQLALDADSDVLTLRSTLCNSGTAPLDVQWLAAATLPLPADAVAVRYFSGRHNHEFVPEEDLLGRGQWRRENRRGLTSHDSFPGALVMMRGNGANVDTDTGCCYAAQLAWSGNHAQCIEWLDDGRYQWQLGEWLAPGEVRLAPGESLATPQVLATCSTSGASGVARNFHQAIRQRLNWPGGAMRPRPVHLNTWEGFYFKHDLAALKSLADAAAEVGIERFVLDDGWFHRRDDDLRALGDWWPDARKYPDGLMPLASHVRALGMDFGLWVEPEMVNPDSELFRAHPDWALQLAGRPLLTARHQLVLDLARTEVAEYLFGQLDGLLRSLPIGYLKWDHNRDLAPAAGADGRASYHRQIHAAYALFDRLRAAHPMVEIESCAGGGGRIDAEILRRTHRFWLSDCIDAVSRLRMQRGFLQFFPPELMGAHIGASPAHSTTRSQSLDFRAAVALPGHLGVELDLRQLSAGERARLKAWIALHKEWRGRLHGATVWQGECGDSIYWQAHGDVRELLLLIYRLAPTERRYAPAVRLPCVEPAARYRVRRVDCEPLHGEAAPEFDGAWLQQAGLPLPAMSAEGALLIYLERL